MNCTFWERKSRRRNYQWNIEWTLQFFIIRLLVFIINYSMNEGLCGKSIKEISDETTNSFIVVEKSVYIQVHHSVNISETPLSKSYMENGKIIRNRSHFFSKARKTSQHRIPSVKFNRSTRLSQFQVS